jgi:sigma-E factor negative regulatory protein RseC
MSKATGYVMRAEGDYVEVETQVESSCGHCLNSRDGACGTGTLSSLFGKRTPRLRLYNGIHAKIGDRVEVHVDDHGVVLGSLLIYLLPLLALMGGAGVGEWILGEPGAILFGLGGGAVGLMGVHLLERQQRMRELLQTTLMRPESLVIEKRSLPSNF